MSTTGFFGPLGVKYKIGNRWRSRSGTGWAGQLIVVRGAAGEELEDGVGAEGVVVVLVGVAGEDAVDAGPDPLQEGVIREGLVAGVVERVGEGAGQADGLVERADGEQPGVAGELAWRRLDDKHDKRGPKKSWTCG
jgi:hypothetical protein